MSAETERSGHSNHLQYTPLHGLHKELGARMVPFAGYDMPVQYALGIMGEHNHARAHAGFFDVSHMGQAYLTGHGIADALEKIVPANIKSLGEGRMRYSQLLNDQGGIIDDLMITNLGMAGDQERYFLVVNAACKDRDLAHIGENIDQDIKLEPLLNRSLLALQGPKAATVACRLWPELAEMPFMSARHVALDGDEILASRCGYTGMDGFEFSVADDKAENFARWLLGQEEVAPIGLGARDSLRLEAGLCLYGHDIDESTTPVEAGLLWSISKRRRTEGGFPGDKIIKAQIENGMNRTLVGIKPEGRAPAREGTDIENSAGENIGIITSGGFGPSIGGPIAMGYVARGYETEGTQLNLIVRGRALPARVAALPFVQPSFYRKKK